MAKSDITLLVGLGVVGVGGYALAKEGKLPCELQRWMHRNLGGVPDCEEVPNGNGNGNGTHRFRITDSIHYSLENYEWDYAYSSIRLRFTLQHQGPNSGSQVFAIGAEVSRATGPWGIIRTIGWKREGWFEGFLEDTTWNPYSFNNFILSAQPALRGVDAAGYWNLRIYVKSERGATLMQEDIDNAVLI